MKFPQNLARKKQTFLNRFKKTIFQWDVNNAGKSDLHLYLIEAFSTFTNQSSPQEKPNFSTASTHLPAHYSIPTEMIATKVICELALAKCHL
ncbi:CLUMA_CG018569, isoform A [Clunio marinus]|uniref:CLUMA_CG018569, isoform A n=1 Tax=Clunio marinus TaxID=568069 RepID=A0A1J1IZS2_9DIPT|nr:CLUMA_CG018569, isoform A [Clunio marinus]